MEALGPIVGQGIARAVLMLVPVFIALVTTRRRRDGPAAIGGVLAVAAATASIIGENEALAGLVVGAGLAFGGARMAGRLGWRPPARVALCLPGTAIGVLALDPGSQAWVLPVAIVAGASVGATADVVDERFGGSGASMPMLTLSALGSYLMLPETGLIAPVAGALMVVAALGWPLSLVRLGSGGGPAVAVVLAAVSVNGAQFRPAAIVAAMAAPALLVLLALVPPNTAPDHGRPGHATVVQLIVLQGLLALTIARTAGLQQRPLVGLALVAPLLLVGWWVSLKVTERAVPS